MTTTATSEQPIRWGIVGTGRIANDFAAALKRLPDARLVAVASRSQTSADAFADLFDVPRRYASLPELLGDDTVDALYVAVPASGHAEVSIAAIKAGKHVLVEKPFAMDEKQAQSMVDAARDAQVFLMEAMWTRFLPAHRRAAQLLEDGRIGQILGVSATMGVRMWPDLIPANDRMLDPRRGGGVLLDVGVYPIQLALAHLGRPTSAAAVAVTAPSGVELDVRAALTHSDGRVSDFSTSMTTRLPNKAYIFGSLGWLQFPAPHHCPDSLQIHLHSPVWNEPPTIEHFDEPIGGDGMRYQAQEVHRCIRAGITESPVMTWIDSISIMATVDLIRSVAISTKINSQGEGPL